MNTKWVSLLLFATVAAGGASGCGAVIEPGHRGLLFDSHHGGLRHDVLQPGYHWLGIWGRVDDFDVTYSTKKEEIHTISSEGLTLEIKLAVIFRPVVSELYDLDVEIGPQFYEEVVGPEFRTATRGVFARHPYLELQRNNERIEDEIEAEVRRRIQGKHVEISSVTLEEVNYAPEIAGAVRAKLVGEQEAARKKAALESDALRQKLEMEQAAEREKLQTEADIRRKEKERRIAEEQAAIDKVQAETEASTKVTRARADAESVRLLAKAHSEERKAEAVNLTPLMVQLHAYDALAKLGGSGTTIMLGDWSRVPNFLFPQFPGMMRAAGKRVAAAAPERDPSE